MDRSTKRISKLQAELDAETVLLQESRARLARLESQQAATPDLQQMVNQLQAERDALCVELRQSRVAKDRTPWSGDALPDVTMIHALPEDHQAIEEWMASRNLDLRDALFGLADVISFVSNLLAQGAAKLAARRASAVVLQSMEVQTSLGSRMGALIDESDAKRRCVEGGGH